MSTTRLEPTGGPGGEAFGDYLIPDDARLREIHVYANWCVDGLQMTFINDDGSIGQLPKMGAAGGIHHVFFLADDEYLNGISGRSGWYIDSIQFHTNKRSSHVYGGAGGEEAFFLRASAGEEIAGLFGRAGWYVDALGVIVRERASEQTVDSGQSAVGSQSVLTQESSSHEEAVSKTIGTRTSTLEVELPPSSVREPLPRDLEKVEGIGPRIAALLIDHGIYDLADLAQTSLEQLREILTVAGRRYNIADPTTWPEQAALGAKGAWDALAELQAKLKSGRRR